MKNGVIGPQELMWFVVFLTFFVLSALTNISPSSPYAGTTVVTVCLDKVHKVWWIAFEIGADREQQVPPSE